jgi:hypothetical protein
MRRDPRGLGSWTPDMGPGIASAQQELAEAVGAGKLRAWGRLKRDDLEEEIPTRTFRETGIVVDTHGELATIPPRSYEGVRWKWIEFEEDEIKRAWPTLPPASATQWMLTEAKRLKSEGQMGKRDDLVQLYG